MAIVALEIAFVGLPIVAHGSHVSCLQQKWPHAISYPDPWMSYRHARETSNGLDTRLTCSSHASFVKYRTDVFGLEENVLFELRSERVNLTKLSLQFSSFKQSKGY